MPCTFRDLQMVGEEGRTGGLAIYRPWSIFVNEVLLEPSHVHPIVRCLYNFHPIMAEL